MLLGSRRREDAESIIFWVFTFQEEEGRCWPEHVHLIPPKFTMRYSTSPIQVPPPPYTPWGANKVA